MSSLYNPSNNSASVYGQVLPHLRATVLAVVSAGVVTGHNVHSLFGVQSGADLSTLFQHRLPYYHRLSTVHQRGEPSCELFGGQP